MPGITPTKHVVQGAMVFCLTRPGQVTITAVRPVNPTGHIRVVAYSVRPNPILTGHNLLGGVYGTLPGHGVPIVHTVSTACGTGDSGAGVELGLELSMPSGIAAATSGWEVDYRVGSHTDHTQFPYGVVLCNAPSLDNPTCHALEERYAP